MGIVLLILTAKKRVARIDGAVCAIGTDRHVRGVFAPSIHITRVQGTSNPIVTLTVLSDVAAVVGQGAGVQCAIVGIVAQCVADGEVAIGDWVTIIYRAAYTSSQLA